MKKIKFIGLLFMVLGMFSICVVSEAKSESQSDAKPSIRQTAKEYESIFRYSTLFTAQDVRDWLNSEEKLTQAVSWCKNHGITRVFIESFRDGYTVGKDLLTKAKERFQGEGILVSGCVTPTGMGVASNGWKAVSNYEAPETIQKCRDVFAFTAAIFDEIMIDDFLFTDDTSETSVKARGYRTWSDYRCELMAQVSRDAILAPARQANPRVKIIVKYPQWYDDFHNRGYDVSQQTELFDRIWVGTETRDPDNDRWGRKAQYEAFYIMRWLTDVGKEKTGGGWYDIYGTSPQTYIEQARQTVLGGAKEAMLFHYGEIIRGKGSENVAELLKEMPALFALAKSISNAVPVGILAPKIPNSDPGMEPYIYDFLGMLGIPLVPLNRMDVSYPSALFATQSFDPETFSSKFQDFVREKKSIGITSHLKTILNHYEIIVPDSVFILSIPSEPRDLYNLNETELTQIRNSLLQPFGFQVSGPTRVALYLFKNGGLIVENFRDEKSRFTIDFEKPLEEKERTQISGALLALPKSDSAELEITNKALKFSLSPRSLVAVKLAVGRY